MLASLLARCSANGHWDVDRYAAWAAALRRLRDDWERGERAEPRQLSNYLRDISEKHRADAIQDIIAEHLNLSWRAGQGPLLEAYCTEPGQEFTELASPATVPAELVEDEFLARYQWPHGDAPSLDEFQQRFPNRADIMERLGHRCLDAARFVKLHKRGLGAFSAVWETHDHRIGRRVAIKEPTGKLANRAFQCFAREARVTTGLEHPGIVATREHRPGDGSRPLYVMRLVDGETLAERIRDFHLPRGEQTSRERTLHWSQLLEWFVQVCEAIAYAHEKGVLHRDLKPGNVIVEDDGPAAVLDWGMAVPSVDAMDGSVAGTPDYMPPEQAHGFADIRSDVFGLGAILYEILTGRSPHGWENGARPADWLRLVCQAQFHPPHQWRPQTPHALEVICMKALSAEPDQRYQSATELAVEVRRYLAGQTTEGRARSSFILKASVTLREYIAKCLSRRVPHF